MVVSIQSNEIGYVKMSEIPELDNLHSELKKYHIEIDINDLYFRCGDVFVIIKKPYYMPRRRKTLRFTTLIFVSTLDYSKICVSSYTSFEYMYDILKMHDKSPSGMFNTYRKRFVAAGNINTMCQVVGLHCTDNIVAYHTELKDGTETSIKLRRNDIYNIHDFLEIYCSVSMINKDIRICYGLGWHTIN